MRYFIATFITRYSYTGTPDYKTKTVNMDELARELRLHIGHGMSPTCLVNQIEIDEETYTKIREEENDAYQKSFDSRMETLKDKKNPPQETL